LVLASSWEAQARAVANAKAEPLGIALSKVKQSQEWKLGVLASTTAPWQVELVMNEDREKVAWLIARLESRKRVEALLAGPSIEEWKIKILSKEMEDWKYQMLLQADEEEKALCIESQRSRTMCELLLKAEESWRLNALSEAANAGFWLAHLVSRYRIK